ncbi:hypothetical protein PRIPAC_75391 [Pristionchus pacificus]|uniref:Uncharacterized protein n=1 Tax=Pristionchus pacificus TaxID=54126 RepID=A0A2A6C7R4_PRIPA|nr:hypothetical protein PRIPAC_75391 [Pristionchus pacificus]|eukprot:PDM74224.1 hypothetical protein PRIPAC_41580 [Pristionchus pacificus]
MLEQRCCLAGSTVLALFAVFTLFGVFNSEHEACHRTDTFALLDKLQSINTLFILGPLLITVLLVRRYSCLLPLVRFELYFCVVVLIFRLGALSGTAGASFGGCPAVCILSVICMLLSGSLIIGVPYVVEELQEMQRMHYLTDSSI